MEEARYSLNVRFNFHGYDSQLTLRDDDNCSDLVTKFRQALAVLENMGATPARSNGNGYGSGNGNGKTEPGSAQQPLDTSTKPICRHCGSSEHMELIDFERPQGVPRREWKCTACQKWHYDKPKK